MKRWALNTVEKGYGLIHLEGLVNSNEYLSLTCMSEMKILKHIN